MFFTFLTFLAAFSIEALGTYISVIGLSSLFASNPIIILLAVSLDIGKIVAVSFIYKYWNKINLLMRSYMLAATIVLVIITSAGAFGFLSGEFQKAIAGNNQQTIIITALEEEKIRLQKRKEEIDTQIARLPENSIRGRTSLLRQFAPEVNRLNSRLAEIDQQLPELKVKNIEKEVKVGPIIYVAEAFGTTPEHAVKWVILVIIFVFDPLAIALLLAGNFLVENRNKKEEKQVNLDEPAVEQKPETELSKIIQNYPREIIQPEPENQIIQNYPREIIKSELEELKEVIEEVTEEIPVRPVDPIVSTSDDEIVPSKSLEKIDHSRADVSFSNNRTSSVRSTYRR
jgi:hypothetical protein